MVIPQNPYSIPLYTRFYHAKGGFAWTYKGTDIGPKNQLYLVFSKTDPHTGKYWHIRSANSKTLERNFPALKEFRRDA